MLKLVATTAIIGLGIAGAYFVVHNSALSLSGANAIEIKTSENNAVNNIPKIEQLNDKTLAANKAENNTETNLTDFMTQQLGQKIAEQNPNGAQTINNEKWVNAPDVDAITQDLIAEAAGKFNPEDLKPIINDNDIKISTDNSKKALISYFDSFNKIIWDSGKNIPKEILENNLDEISEKTIEQLISIYKNTSDDLYKLIVPEIVFSLHKKELILLGAKRTIFEKIKNYKSDPITTIMAAKNLEGIDNEFSDLNKEIYSFAKSNNLIP